MGMLYNAHRAGTPLIVTAGQQDRRLKFEEPILGSDMVAPPVVLRRYTVRCRKAVVSGQARSA